MLRANERAHLEFSNFGFDRDLVSIYETVFVL